MFLFLLALHSVLRWLVLLGLLFALFRALRGFLRGSSFTPMDNAVRHWSATVAHVQLMVGIVLYSKSAVAKYAFTSGSGAAKAQAIFFGMVHAGLMVIAIVVLTIGSALAKRKATDREKFRTMLIWYSLALLLIVAAIPWPFSPFAQRPFFRSF